MRKCRTCEHIIIKDVGEYGHHMFEIYCKHGYTHDTVDDDCKDYEPYKGHSEQDIFRTWKEYWWGYE